MAERTDFTTLGHAVEMHFSDGKTVRLEGEVARLQDLAVALESAVAERDAMLRDARALMRHDSVCAVNGPRWCWDQARQLSTCRACGAEYDVDRPGHRHDCDCGRDSLVARLDAALGKESSRG